MRRTGQSTYKAFLTNLREVAERYYDAKGIKSFGTLHCAFIMKQYLSSLPDNVRAFVLSKQPETADQAAEYSDLFFELSRINKDNGIQEWEPRGTLAWYHRVTLAFSRTRTHRSNLHSDRLGSRMEASKGNPNLATPA